MEESELFGVKKVGKLWVQFTGGVVLPFYMEQCLFPTFVYCIASSSCVIIWFVSCWYSPLPQLSCDR